jgi:hypothetical protein
MSFKLIIHYPYSKITAGEISFVVSVSKNNIFLRLWSLSTISLKEILLLGPITPRH